MIGGWMTGGGAENERVTMTHLCHRKESTTVNTRTHALWWSVHPGRSPPPPPLTHSCDPLLPPLTPPRDNAPSAAQCVHSEDNDDGYSYTPGWSLLGQWPLLHTLSSASSQRHTPLNKQTTISAILTRLIGDDHHHITTAQCTLTTSQFEINKGFHKMIINYQTVLSKLSV